MGRNSVSPEIASPTEDNNGDLSFRANHERSLFKRAHPPQLDNQHDRTKSSDRHVRGGAGGNRPSQHQQYCHNRRKAFQFRGRSMIYFLILLAVFGFALATMVLQSSVTSMVFRQGNEGGGGRRGWISEGLKFGSSLKFVASRRFFDEEGRLDRLRKVARVAVRPPRLALVLGNTKKNPQSLMLFTVVKNLQLLGYRIKLYAVEDGEARTIWEQIGGQVSILNPEKYGHLDWSLFEGVIADSIEAKEVISSLMQEPFCSIPLIWIIQEDALAKRILLYKKMGWEHLITHWRRAFSRADVVVFPDFSLPMLYSDLDDGNFFVIPGSPIDVWAAESYVKIHSKHNMRKKNGYGPDDFLVVVVGSSLFFNELSWDYAVAMHTIGPLLIKYAKRRDVDGSFKFIFLCGNSTDGYTDVLQEVATRLRVIPDSLRHYGMNSDVNGVLFMADIVLYGSSQEEQSFPPLLVRAMSFGIPIIAPDLPVMQKHLKHGVHGMVFSEHNPDDLLQAFSLLVSRDGKLSKYATTVGSSGKRLAKNFLASECISGYAKLIENLVHFPSDASLPSPITQIQQQHGWEWNAFRIGTALREGGMMSTDENDTITQRTSIIYSLEDVFNNLKYSRNISEESSGDELDPFSAEDWDAVEGIESFQEFERQEMEQLEERMDKNPGNWDEIYRNARKSEKLRFEANERDEGELERTGQPVCIYEIYSGAGTWPFLHHGSLYRGLSLSTRSTRLSSDDIDAVSRLPFLNNSYYRDLLCEIGGMFSIAYKVDDIHKRPWIGFQSWQASGRKVSLSHEAEGVLEGTIQRETKGDVMYFWTRLDMDTGVTESNDLLTFWSMCDILNGGQCRSAFENTFRHMYALPLSVEALPPMPEDGGHWSALHSWVMPTSSFLEFMMFSRIFVDSLNTLHGNTSKPACLLGLSQLEKKHCYCRILDLLVNVWAYHSAQRMVYMDPHTGLLQEQHPIERRKGFMWVKYFNSTLLKNMDEDLAEAADDGNNVQGNAWLWPLTGEVHWQGVYEREREERYRLKMDKKRKTKEKLLERMKYGYKQKSLGR
ncbi:hypothetical protein Ancab_001250 [Ancistrocladus abbreviatus]